MAQEEKSLLLKDLCARLPYGVKLLHIPSGETTVLEMMNCDAIDGDIHDMINNFQPYLRPISSMTEGEKKELLCTIVGKDAVKHFQVLSDGSIDNTDAAYQDLHNFTMHWINFDGSNTTSYIDWLNKYHFDYRGLIKKGLAIEVTEDNNPYK